MDGTGDQRVLRRRGIAAEGQPGGQAQRPRYGRGKGRRQRTYPRSSASQAKQQSTPLGLPHNEGWRPGTRSGRSAARFGSVSAWGPGRGRAGTGPDSTCGEDLTELGVWPRKGLPVAWQWGPTTRVLHCGGAEIGAHGWDRASLTACEPTMGCCCSVWAGWQSCHPNTVASGPMCKTPGGPHWSRRLGQAVVNWVRQHSTTAKGPGSRIQGRTSNLESELAEVSRHIRLIPAAAVVRWGVALNYLAGGLWAGGPVRRI